MSDNKTTPGPWKWNRGLFHSEDKEIIFSNYYGELVAYNKADAALIAAAPDLLAACEAALPWFEDAKGSGKRDGDLLRDAIKNAKAAL